MSSQPDKIMQCPICLETMKSPITQCMGGHSMCGDCIKANNITKCPTCRGAISKIRNFQLEQLIEGIQKVLKLQCCYHSKGCTYSLSVAKKESHELECKYRNFICEGHKFAKWKCQWSGTLEEMYKHFKKDHINQQLSFKSEADMKFDLSRNYSDVQMITYLEGGQYFFYKHRVDVKAEKIYWAFQFIGPKNQAECYYYEFEVANGPIKKFKVTEICRSDVVSADKIFEKGQCVVIPFEVMRNFMDEENVSHFRYRLMSIKKAK
ncbi:unnamed protein product [Brassicogethes aeneus]|uniref:E3 ubiquitin-protein ligase n=1 Tax=Brassicogethes aeneus TaxID=1431903 RepID=A0A9P0BFV3_BRAAE|nr:unnamed protein product [Brassicogethes aeneus]